jgi:tetratricopeptide (TPR) repeat protein
MVLYGFLGVLALGLLGYFILTEVSQNRREDASILAEQVSEILSDWSSEENEEKKKELEEKILTETDIILDAYPRQYAAQRALYVRGTMLFEKQEWQKAYDEYDQLSSQFPKSYLAEEGLFRAAVCKEELDDLDGAMELYTKFIETYKESPRTAHVYFSLGRLNETKEEYEKAQEFYNTLKLDYPTSNWTNMAINRIIDLTRRGKISE